MSEGNLTKEQITGFLVDLEEISRKHGITIGGCGCCASPYLEPMDDETDGYCYSAFTDWSLINWTTKTKAEDMELRNQRSGLEGPVTVRSDRR